MCDLFSGLPDVALFAGLCKTGSKQIPPAVSLAKAIVNPQLIEKQNKTKQKLNRKNENETERANFRRKSVPAKIIMLSVAGILSCTRSAVPATHRRAPLQWSNQQRTFFSFFSLFFFFFRAPVHIQLVWWHWWNWLTVPGPLWSPRASLQAWLLAARAAHFGAPELLCKRGSLQPELLTLEPQKSCSLWSSRASLQAWLLGARAAHLEP